MRFGGLWLSKKMGGIYTTGNNSLLGRRVLEEVDPIAFAPYAFLKRDVKQTIATHLNREGAPQ